MRAAVHGCTHPAAAAAADAANSLAPAAAPASAAAALAAAALAAAAANAAAALAVTAAGGATCASPACCGGGKPSLQCQNSKRNSPLHKPVLAPALDDAGLVCALHALQRHRCAATLLLLHAAAGQRLGACGKQPKVRCAERGLAIVRHCWTATAPQDSAKYPPGSSTMCGCRESSAASGDGAQWALVRACAAAAHGSIADLAMPPACMAAAPWLRRQYMPPSRRLHIMLCRLAHLQGCPIEAALPRPAPARRQAARCCSCECYVHSETS